MGGFFTGWLYLLVTVLAFAFTGSAWAATPQFDRVQMTGPTTSFDAVQSEAERTLQAPVTHAVNPIVLKAVTGHDTADPAALTGNETQTKYEGVLAATVQTVKGGGDTLSLSCTGSGGDTKRV